MLESRWKIEMFGRLAAVQGEREVTRFRTYKTGALLAYLAHYGHRPHPREELMEMLWSDCNPVQGRNSLSQSLSSLRHQLEPPGVATGTVLEADRFQIRLNPETYTTDVQQFEETLRAAAKAPSEADLIAQFEIAAALYQGEFLPGHYEDWNLTERERLRELYLKTLDSLIRYWERAEQTERAMEIARRALAADASREETHITLIRLHAALGQNNAALRQFQALTTLLKEYGASPDAETRALILNLKPMKPHREQNNAPLTPQVWGEPRANETVSPLPELGEGLGVRAVPHPSSLPLPLSRFFGRTLEQEQLERLLTPESETHSRLVTLTGMGGMGKTRLALEVAGRLRPAYQNAVWFVPLAALTDPNGIFTAIAEAMKLYPSGKQEIRDEVEQALLACPTLLVLDNFEQLLPVETMPAFDSTAAIRTLLERVPTLHCLVTSRRRLGIAGEQEIPLASLPVPVVTETPEQLIQWDCVRLFTDRAQNVRPDFQITSNNAAALAELCRSLEGIPLAIELAAARSQALTPPQILQRLSNRLDFLADRRQHPEARHQTLRAAVEWSYHLLSPELQAFFASLSVLRGGFTLEAAEAVSGDSLALDNLAMLRECSLIQADEVADGTMRFRLMEALREYASERLNETDSMPFLDRHAAYFLEAAQEADTGRIGRELAVWRERLETEQDNFRAALDHFEKQQNPSGLVLASALRWFWETTGHLTEGRKRLNNALEHNPTSDAAARAKAYNAAGILSMRQGDFPSARIAFEAAHTLLPETNDPNLSARVLGSLGTVAWYQGEYETARPYCEQSLELARASGNPRAVAQALGQLALVTQSLDDWEASCELEEESLALYRRLEDSTNIAVTLNNLSGTYRHLERWDEARSSAEESLELFRQQQNRWHIALALDSFASLLYDFKEFDTAKRYYRESLEIQRDIGDQDGIAFSLEGIGRILCVEGNFAGAAQLLGAAEGLREEIGTLLPQVDKEVYHQALAILRANLAAKELAIVWKKGRLLTPEQAITLAFSD